MQLIHDAFIIKKAYSESAKLRNFLKIEVKTTKAQVRALDDLRKVNEVLEAKLEESQTFKNAIQELEARIIEKHEEIAMG